MRQWSAGLVACAVTVPLLLAGCSAKHEASQSLPTTSRTTAAKTLPPLGPADFPVPAEARVKSAAGASAFARYFIALANHQLTSLDSAPLRQLSRDCKTCESLAEGYDTNKQAGYHYQGGQLAVKSLGEASVVGDGAEIAFLLQQDAVSVLDSNNNAVPGKSSDGYPLSGGMSLHWDNVESCWLVTELTAERS